MVPREHGHPGRHPGRGFEAHPHLSARQLEGHPVARGQAQFCRQAGREKQERLFLHLVDGGCIGGQFLGAEDPVHQQQFHLAAVRLRRLDFMPFREGLHRGVVGEEAHPRGQLGVAQSGEAGKNFIYRGQTAFGGLCSSRDNFPGLKPSASAVKISAAGRGSPPGTKSMNLRGG